MTLALLFLVYVATMVAMLLFYVSVRTSIIWYFAKTAAKHSFDFDCMQARIEIYDTELGLDNYSQIRQENGSFVVSIPGYPGKVFDDKSNIAALISTFPGASSSEKLACFGLERAQMFLRIHNSEGSQLAHKIGIAILHHWFSNRVRFGLDAFAWYETVPSQRRLNCIICIAYLGEDSDENKKLRILLRNEIQACEKHINKTYSYDWSTNHGLIDDSNVLTGNYILGTTGKTRHMLPKSLSRMDYFISDDGVVLEPATSYWFMIRNYLTKIIKVQELCGIEMDAATSSRMAAMEQWLSFASVNGLYARIGDTSGANTFTTPHKHKYDQDGVFLWCTDAGLCYLNAVENLKVRGQVFLKSQYCPPLVHAHQDALAVNLISDGIVWINSPGYFSPSMKDFGVNIRSVENQSTVWCPTAGYQPKCKIQSVKSDNAQTRVCASIDLSDSCTLTRTVEYDSSSGDVLIADETSSADAVQSTFLFDAAITAELVDGKCLLRHEDNEVLELVYEAESAKLEEGCISFVRNEMIQSKKLVLSGSKNSLKFKFTKPGQNVINLPSNEHPYASRQPSSVPYSEKLRKASLPFHFRRLRRLMVMLTAVTLMLTIVILIFGF